MEIHKLSFIDYAWRMIIYNDCWKVSSNFIFEIRALRIKLIADKLL